MSAPSGHALAALDLTVIEAAPANPFGIVHGGVITSGGAWGEA